MLLHLAGLAEGSLDGSDDDLNLISNDTAAAQQAITNMANGGMENVNKELTLWVCPCLSCGASSSPSPRTERACASAGKRE